MMKINKDPAKILIVDTDLKHISELKSNLSAFPVELYQATTSNQAASLILKHKFVLILLDNALAESDGYTVLESLSLNKLSTCTAVILLASKIPPESLQLKGYRLGAVDYLLKPLNKEILLTKVKVFVDLFHQRMRYQHLTRRYQLILNAAGEGVIEINLKGNIRFINPAAAKLLGYSTHDLIGKPFDKILITSHQHRFEWRHSDIYLTCKRGEVLHNTDACFQKNTGEILPVEFTATPLQTDLNEGGELISVVMVFSDITLQKTTENQLTQLALYDYLTELPNRLLFEKTIVQTLARAERHQNKVAVMFVDLDHFKNINDALGHDIGDTLLKNVANRFRSCLRESDIIARLGGDEFAIVLDEIIKREDVVCVCNKIIDILKPPFKIKQHEVSTSASIGIALYPENGEDGLTLIRNADMAMYKAKHYGRNTYQFYNPAANKPVIQRLNLAHHLRYALERNELFLCYQPKLQLKTNQISGMEALLRWNHPKLGVIHPEKIIPLAEEMGLMADLGQWILATATLQAKKWGVNNPYLTLAINISASQLIKLNLEKLLQSSLRESGLQAYQIELELTETSIMLAPNQSRDTLLNLHNLGIKIAIDDFGTGYSSLSYLKSLPIHTLKIDRCFISDIESNENDNIIVKTIIGLGHNMNLNVVAEGVENRLQRDLLISYQCDEIQGFYLSPPLSGEEMSNFLHQYGK